MNIYDFAIQKEIEGEAFYRDLSSKSSSLAMKQILGLLADEEVKHRQALEKLKTGSPNAELAVSKTLAESKTVFQQMAKGINIEGFNNEETEFYRQALAAEVHSRNVYQDHADKAETPELKALFKRLAAEERMHQSILEGVIQMFENPKRWLEDAEWSHIGEEY